MSDELEKAAIEEIQKYKWIESERLGYDIGFKRAGQEWAEKYGEAFEKYFESMIDEKPVPAKKKTTGKTAKKASTKAKKGTKAKK